MKWISVNKHPDKLGQYLVFRKTKMGDSDISICGYIPQSELKQKLNFTGWMCGPVTHWMPLPEPPNEDNTDTD